MEKLVPITHENSTVDGSDWSAEDFAKLDFSGSLYSDTGYHCGCLKYVPEIDDDDGRGHRVRSTYCDATAVKDNGAWMWLVRTIITE